MRKNIIVFVTAILALFVGVFLQWKFELLTKIVPINLSDVGTGINSAEKPVSTLTIIDLGTCKLYTIINSSSIWFEPFENALCGSKSGLAIENDLYPNLFKQGVGNSSFISISKSDNPNSVLVTNNQPDHGGYSPTYELEVNIKTGEIKELEIKDPFQDYYDQIKESN